LAVVEAASHSTRAALPAVVDGSCDEDEEDDEGDNDD
jgi:hypothetical protein